MKPATAPVETNAIQYISLSKFFGFPFQAAYPIVAAIDGAITKKMNKIIPSSTHTPTLVCMAV